MSLALTRCDKKKGILSLIMFILFFLYNVYHIILNIFSRIKIFMTYFPNPFLVPHFRQLYGYSISDLEGLLYLFSRRLKEWLYNHAAEEKLANFKKHKTQWKGNWNVTYCSLIVFIHVKSLRIFNSCWWIYNI